MSDIIPKVALYHAQQGNFSGFRVSIPLDLSEDNLIYLFNNIRDNMNLIFEETTSWFDFDEFMEYANNPLNTLESLQEVATMQTRMKLRRAAKRTSKRRSRKRFMRRKMRKNATQLKKRAYSQVKTEMRRKLSGNRPWDSIPLSTRMRIDNQINKRKTMLNRMVKTRIPKMAGQESKRLQRVRLNTSFEFPTLKNVLLEAKRLKRPTGTNSNDARKFERITAQNTLNQRNRRKKINGNLSDFLNTLMVVRSGSGATLIISKNSYQPSQHQVLQDVGNVTMEKAESATKKSTFDQTESSQKLFGLVKKEKQKAKRKEKKENEDKEAKGGGGMKKSNGKGDTEEVTPEPIIQPPPPRDNTVSIGSLFPDSEHSPENIKVGFVVAFNLINSGNSVSSIMNLLSNAQQAMRSKEVGALIEPEQKQAEPALTKILKEQGLSDDDISNIIGSQTLLPAGFRLSKFLLSNKNITGIGDLSVFYAMNSSLVSIPPISSYQNMGGDDPSYTSDILFLNKNTVVNSLKQNTQTSPQKLIEEFNKHIDMVAIASGQTVDIKGKNLSPAQIKEAQSYAEEFVKNNGSLGVMGISLKAGDEILIESNIQGDANAIVEGSLLTSNLKPEEKKRFTDIAENLFKNFDKIKVRDEKRSDTTNNVYSSYDSRGINYKKTQDKFKKEVTQNINDLLESVKSIKSSILFQELTGSYKFGDSILSTKFIITCSNDGTDGVITEVTKDYSDLVADSLILRIGLQEGIVNTPEQQQINMDFDDAVDKRAKQNKTDRSVAEKEIRKEIQETRISITNKIKDKSAANMDEAKSILFDELREKGMTPTQVTQKLNLQEKPYNYMDVLDPSTINENGFKFNPILRFLVEKNTEEDTQDTKLTDMEKQEYLENAKKWMGDDIYKMLLFCNVSPNIVSFSGVNLKDFANKESNGEVNTLYIHGTRKDVAVEKEVDYDKLMSEYYGNIGKTFLAEAKKKRDYTKDIEYESSPKQRHNRVKRVLARRFMEKRGLVHKGDGKDVDHKDGDPTNNSPKNLRVMSRSKNRAKH